MLSRGCCSLPAACIPSLPSSATRSTGLGRRLQDHLVSPSTSHTFHFRLDCKLFKSVTSLPMSGPWGHQCLVAVTGHHPHVFCPVIQELYFRLCLQGCLCPHLLDGPQTYTGGIMSPNLHHSVVSTPFSAPDFCWSRLEPWKDVLNHPCLVWDCQSPLAAPALPSPSDVRHPGWWGHWGHPQLLVPSPLWKSPEFAACWLGSIWHERVFLQC